MRHSRMIRTLAFAGPLLASVSFANGATKFELTITNGSQMPISPAAIYVKSGGEPSTAVGSSATKGFVQLCQAGNPMERIKELKADSSVKFSVQTTAPILPGETKSIEVAVLDPQKQSIHFETMYGKTKDVCGIGSFNSHSLVALKQRATTEALAKDNTVLTGAFTEPVLFAGATGLDPVLCSDAADAISCLRELSNPVSGNPTVRFFSGYFPSLVNALESKYGSADVQTLMFPVSGAIQFKLKLKH